MTDAPWRTREAMVRAREAPRSNVARQALAVAIRDAVRDQLCRRDRDGHVFGVAAEDYLTRAGDAVRRALDALAADDLTAALTASQQMAALARLAESQIAAAHHARLGELRMADAVLEALPDGVRKP